MSAGRFWRAFILWRLERWLRRWRTQRERTIGVNGVQASRFPDQELKTCKRGQCKGVYRVSKEDGCVENTLYNCHLSKKDHIGHPMPEYTLFHRIQCTRVHPILEDTVLEYTQY